MSRLSQTSLLTVLIILCGCSKRAPAARWTEQQISSIVVPGKTKAQVDQVFGAPVTDTPGPNGTTRFIYQFPERGLPPNFENLLTGMQVEYKDRYVVRWLPVYSDQYSVTPQRPTVQSHGARRPNLPITLWVLYETNFPGSVEVNTQVVKGNTYAARRPSLVLTSFSAPDPVVAQAGSRRIYGFNLHLAREEAEELAAFTKTNLGNRILMLLGTNSLTAPVLREPIADTGSFTVTFQSEADYKRALHLFSQDENGGK